MLTNQSFNNLATAASSKDSTSITWHLTNKHFRFRKRPNMRLRTAIVIHTHARARTYQWQVL